MIAYTLITLLAYTLRQVVLRLTCCYTGNECSEWCRYHTLLRNQSFSSQSCSNASNARARCALTLQARSEHGAKVSRCRASSARPIATNSSSSSSSMRGVGSEADDDWARDELMGLSQASAAVDRCPNKAGLNGVINLPRIRHTLPVSLSRLSNCGANLAWLASWHAESIVERLYHSSALLVASASAAISQQVYMNYSLPADSIWRSGRIMRG